MKKSFIDFLTENQTVETMLQRMVDELEVCDKGKGDEFVVRDKKLMELTGKEHKFDVRLHGHGDVEVHPHNEHDHDRAAELERKLMEVSTPVLEASDEKRARIAASIKKEAERVNAQNKKYDAEKDAAAEKKHGNGWRKVLADKAQADNEAHNEKVRAANKNKKPVADEDKEALERQADAYVGRKKGKNRSTD